VCSSDLLNQMRTDLRKAQEQNKGFLVRIERLQDEAKISAKRIVRLLVKPRVKIELERENGFFTLVNNGTQSGIIPVVDETLILHVYP